MFDFEKYKMAYMVLTFYFLITVVGATAGDMLLLNDGFTKGFLAMTVVSLALWFTYGKSMSNI